MAARPRDPSVLFIDIVNADQFPGRVNETVPLIRGYLKAHGVRNRCLRFGLSTDNQRIHDSDAITFSRSELSRLLEIASSLRPTLLLLSDGLALDQLRAIEGAACAGDMRRRLEVQDLRREEFQGLESHPRFMGTRELDDADFYPDYSWEPGNEAAHVKRSDNIYLRAVAECGHFAPLSRNKAYGSLVFDEGEHFGCSFCQSRCRPTPDARADAGGARTPLSWYTRQLEAVVATRAGMQLPYAFLCERLEGRSMLRHVTDELRRLGLDRSVRLLLAARSDQAQGIDAVLREQLASQEPRQLRVGVYASGIESFVKEDLELFNKGTEVIDSLRSPRLLMRLNQDFPEAFEVDGLSLILFTPWTRLEGLQLNLRLVQHLGLIDPIGNLFEARMRLHRELPVTALAEQHGLLKEREEDEALVMNRRKLFSAELPWRFQDARLDPIARVMLRFEDHGASDDSPGIATDEISAAITDALEAFPESVRRYGSRAVMLDLSLAMTELLAGDSARKPDESPSPAGLLRRASARVREEARLRRAWRGRDKLRVGGELLALERALPHFASLLRDTKKDIVSLDGLSPRSVEALPDQGAHRHGLALRWIPGHDDEAPGTLLLANSEKAIDDLLAASASLERATDDAARRRGARELGAVFGYPACCVDAWASSAFSSGDLWTWAFLAGQALDTEAQDKARAPFNEWLLPDLAFVPCSPRCAAARETLWRWSEALGIPAVAHEQLAVLRPFDPGAPLEDISVVVTGTSDDGLTYDRASVVGGDLSKALGDALKRGTSLHTRPGQLLVVGSTDRVLCADTLVHGLRFAGRSWDDEEWEEIAQAAAENRQGDDPTRGLRLAASLASERPTVTQGSETRSLAWLEVRFSDRGPGQPRCRLMLLPASKAAPGDDRIGGVALRRLSGETGPLAEAASTALRRAMHEIGEAPSDGNLTSWKRQIVTHSRHIEPLRACRLSILRRYGERD